MYYLQLDTPLPGGRRSSPRETVHGPFCSANEAQAYWTKLNMWFPEALEEASYKITALVQLGSMPAEHTPRNSVEQ